MMHNTIIDLYKIIKVVIIALSGCKGTHTIHRTNTVQIINSIVIITFCLNLSIRLPNAYKCKFAKLKFLLCGNINNFPMFPLPLTAKYSYVLIFSDRLSSKCNFTNYIRAIVTYFIYQHYSKINPTK